MWNYFYRHSKRLFVSQETDLRKQDRDQQNILFIGNSYTGYNDLPVLVQRLFESTATLSPRIHVQSHYPPGEDFAGHVKNMEGRGWFGKRHILHKWLAKEPTPSWTWVILQDYSRTPGRCGGNNSNDDDNQADTDPIFATSLECAKKLNAGAANAGANTMFYMTWGRRDGDRGNKDLYPDFSTMQALTTQGYQRYLEATSSPERPTYVAPVGLVFETIYNDCQKKSDTTLFRQLYDADGSHPSLEGSYVAALTIYASLTGKNVAQNVTWKPEGLDEQTATTIREAVQRTIDETADNKLIVYPWQPQQERVTVSTCS